jgi:glycine/D-amino acid oxidase-like deaminating enzyme
MDLRSGHPFWQLRDPPPPVFPALTSDASCDVAVIGAGLCGAMAAHELVNAGFSCVVLDKRQPGEGSTAASTALLLHELDTPLHELVAKIGEADAARCYRLGVEAIDAIDRVTRALPDRCGFERRSSLLLASRDDDEESLKKEYGARARAGLDVELLIPADLSRRGYSFSAPAALLTNQGAQVDGYRLTHELLRAGAARGLAVHSGTRVRAIERGPKTFRVRTESGLSVTSTRVVLASGYESIQLRPIPGKLVSTYAVATSPIERFDGWPDRCLIWETAHPYIYIRTTADGRAMIGGGDEPITDPDERDRLIGPKCVQLMRRFRSMYPAIEARPEVAWAGFFIETEHGLPYIGEDPTTPGLYLALCFGANGSTFAAVAARVIRELITTGSSRDARLFRLDRKS